MVDNYIINLRSKALWTSLSCILWGGEIQISVSPETPSRELHMSVSKDCARGLSLRRTADAESNILCSTKTRCRDTGRSGIRLFLTWSFISFLLICSSWNRDSSLLLLGFCLQLWFGSAEDGRRPYQLNEMIYKAYLHFRNVFSFDLGSFSLNKNYIVNQIHCWGAGSRIFLVSLWHI